jgi:hypothetical protein
VRKVTVAIRKNRKEETKLRTDQKKDGTKTRKKKDYFVPMIVVMGEDLYASALLYPRA